MHRSDLKNVWIALNVWKKIIVLPKPRSIVLNDNRFMMVKPHSLIWAIWGRKNRKYNLMFYFCFSIFIVREAILYHLKI